MWLIALEMKLSCNEFKIWKLVRWNYKNLLFGARRRSPITLSHVCYVLRKISHATIYIEIVSLLELFGFKLHSRIHSGSSPTLYLSTSSMSLQNAILLNWMISCTKFWSVHWKYLEIFLRILSWYVRVC